MKLNRSTVTWMMASTLVLGGLSACTAVSAAPAVIVAAQQPVNGTTAQQATTISPEEAQAIAESAHPGAQATKVDQEQDENGLVYEVKLDNGLEVTVNASDGAILKTAQDEADEGDEINEGEETDQTGEVDEANEADETGEVDEADEPAEMDEANEADETGEADQANEANEADAVDETPPASTGITAEQARAIAEQANPGTSTIAVEFDREGGVDLFEVELDNGQDVKVDAGNGAILSTETRDAN